jgi:hypothetical protein
VAAKHAELQQKGKQVFLKALQGESVFDRCASYAHCQPCVTQRSRVHRACCSEHCTAGLLAAQSVVCARSNDTACPHASCRTYTWIDEQEARPNVSYVLASGSTVAFGESIWQQRPWPAV